MVMRIQNLEQARAEVERIAVEVETQHRKKEIKGLELVFEGGKLNSMNAASGLEPLKNLYDASGPGKDLFGAIDIGINPNVQLVPDSRMETWMPSGMISIWMGRNYWAGGENYCEFSFGSCLPGSTLAVDGKILVENGVLKP